MRPVPARCTVVAVLAVAGVTLVAAAPGLALVHDLTRPHAWVARVGADRAAARLAGAALWLVACWVAVSLGTSLLTAAPRLAASAPARAARATLPAPLRRLVLAAVGLGIVLAPAAAGASTVAPARPVAVTPAPAWPTDTPLPAPAWPSQPAHRPAAHPPATPVTPTPATPTPANPTPANPTPATPPPAGTPGTAARPASVVVQPGDTLWSIAADHLRPGSPARRVARSWPAWFAANRAVIGDDPDLIEPGQHLQLPAAPHASTTTRGGDR